MAGDGRPGLPPFQLEVARMFFALPASRGFLLAGGAALLAQHLTARPTEDLDFFTAPERGHVPAARDALEAAARQRGWITERIHDSDTFCRMVIRSADSGVLIDLAVNAPPDLPASATPAGPTLAPEELAGNKLLAFYVEPVAVLPPSSSGPAAVLVHNCTPEAKVWEPGRPETDNEPQGPLSPGAPMVEPDQALEEGHYHYVVMRGGALRAINSDDMWDLEPSAGHTSLAEGEPVIMAGGFKVDDTGAITEFDNNSGHYMPRDTSGYMPLEEIARAAFARHEGLCKTLCKKVESDCGPK
jgi:hypothetical protein